MQTALILLGLLVVIALVLAASATLKLRKAEQRVSKLERSLLARPRREYESDEEEEEASPEAPEGLGGLGGLGGLAGLGGGGLGVPMSMLTGLLTGGAGPRLAAQLVTRPAPEERAAAEEVQEGPEDCLEEEDV
jgi:uncharacterized membrane protein YfcA